METQLGAGSDGGPRRFTAVVPTPHAYSGQWPVKTKRARARSCASARARSCASVVTRKRPSLNRANKANRQLKVRPYATMVFGSISADVQAKKTQSRGPHLVLPRQERSSQTGNHGTTPPYGPELPPGRTRTWKGEVDSDSLIRVFRWIPWLISDPSGAAIGYGPGLGLDDPKEMNDPDVVFILGTFLGRECPPISAWISVVPSSLTF